MYNPMVHTVVLSIKLNTVVICVINGKPEKYLPIGKNVLAPADCH